MNIFFKIMLFLFVFAGVAGTSRAQTPAGDPNAPAPEASLKLRIPHSQRTKDNILDSVLDFAFVQYFKLFKNAKISYDFFEVDKNYDLNFTGFTIQITRPDLQGNIVFAKAKINLSEFLAFIKGKQLMVSQIELIGSSADMTLIEKKQGGEQKRSLKYSAEKMTMKNILMPIIKDTQNKKQSMTVGTVSAEKASLNLSNPREKYAASSAEIKDFVLSEEGIDRISFSSAENGGKVYTDRAAFLRAIRQ